LEENGKEKINAERRIQKEHNLLENENYANTEKAALITQRSNYNNPVR